MLPLLLERTPLNNGPFMTGLNTTPSPSPSPTLLPSSCSGSQTNMLIWSSYTSTCPVAGKRSGTPRGNTRMAFWGSLELRGVTGWEELGLICSCLPYDLPDDFGLGAGGGRLGVDKITSSDLLRCVAAFSSDTRAGETAALCFFGPLGVA